MIFRVEMNTGQPIREVEADWYFTEGQWLIFRRYPVQGGSAVEYFRANIANVVSMEIKRG